jgi:hypothetical protein
MGKKKKNKKHDMWDLSYEEQQENLRKFDEFLAGKTNDMFVNNTGTDFESQLFSMIDTRRNKETIVDDDKPKPRYFDQYGIFQYTETDGLPDSEDDGVERYHNGLLDTEGIHEDTLEYTPVSFDVDNALHMVFIQSRFERVGLKLNTRIIPDDVVIENEQILGRAFIDYSLFNTVPFALTDKVDDIIKVFNDYGIERYDKEKFKIIYDENDELYRCYIVDTSSAGNLQCNVVKSFREYAELILELENRSIGDINWGYFYDSKYNDLNGFAEIISMDINTTTGDRPMTEDMIGEFGYIITLGNLYEVISSLLELSMEDDEDDDEFNELAEELADMSDEEIEEMVNEVVKEVQPVATVEITTTPNGEVGDKEVVAEVVIDVEDLKDKMQTISEDHEEPHLSDYLTPLLPTSHVDEDESKEDKPVNIPDDIEVTETDPDEIDFDDLSEIPVIRKPKKK